MVLGPDGAKDRNESYQIRKYINGDGGDQPDLLNQNAEVIEKYQRACHSLCVEVMRNLAEILEIPEEDGGRSYFDDKHRYEAKCGSVLRYVRYPNYPMEEDDAESRRMAQHTDCWCLWNFGDYLSERLCLPLTTVSLDPQSRFNYYSGKCHGSLLYRRRRWSASAFSQDQGMGMGQGGNRA